MILCIQCLCTVYNMLHTGIEPCLHGGSRQGLDSWVPTPFYYIFKQKFAKLTVPTFNSLPRAKMKTCTTMPSSHLSLWLVDFPTLRSRLCLISVPLVTFFRMTGGTRKVSISWRIYCVFFLSFFQDFIYLLCIQYSTWRPEFYPWQGPTWWKKKKEEQIPTHCLLTSMIRHVPT